MCVFIDMFTYIYSHIEAMYESTDVFICIYSHREARHSNHVHINNHTYTCIYIDTYAHTYICMYIYMYYTL